MIGPQFPRGPPNQRNSTYRMVHNSCSYLTLDIQRTALPILVVILQKNWLYDYHNHTNTKQNVRSLKIKDGKNSTRVMINVLLNNKAYSLL